ncbi:Ribosomal protein L7Ae [Spironucleus salmonicida]|uniref:H/ACA ribonucleoprotein complex subunit 2 n=1 Tax=Spironucleus salmonicida TaxID=348837 RepID=V6LH07_9EUKA|nr:Ribosomal protein L7Ae [Spironucleus salmonicida]|eukprot:EST43807.1 Ribosomal protein L7Ae [Spironucleus salmonicida]
MTDSRITISAKSIQDDVLAIVKQAKTINRIARGINECTKQAAKSRTRLVVIAADAVPIEIALHLPELCEDKGIICVFVNSRVELGRACGLGRPAVACCIKNANKETPLDKKVAEVILKIEM